MPDAIFYLDFDLLVRRADGGYRAQVLSSPEGEATTDFSLPFSDLELQNFILRLGRPRRGRRRIGSPEMEAARELGRRLYDAVFSGDVRACWRSCVNTADTRNAGLRLRLRIVDAPELNDIPWEYLYNPSLNSFLSLSEYTPLVRYLDLPERIRRLAVDGPLAILVMISSPTDPDYASLNVKDEWSRLSDALAALTESGQVRLKCLSEPTLSALQGELRRGQYHIFHFIGHGGFDHQTQSGVLVLSDRAGKARLVAAEHLATILRDHRSFRLVVLNACEGSRSSREDPFSGVAQTLVQQGIPAVIAMQFEISDAAAIKFAEEFYSAVADGYPVDAALVAARKAIFAEGNDIEWGTPVLYLRAPDGQLFSVNCKAAQRAEGARLAEEKRRADEAARLAEEKRRADEAARLAEEKRRADEAARLAEEKRKADEAAGLAEEKRRADEAARLAEEKRRADEAARLAEEKRKADEAAGLAEEKRRADEAAGLAEEKRRADEAARLAEEKRRADEAARLAEEKRKADEAAGLAEEKRRADEAARLAEEKRKADEAAGLAEEKRRADEAARLAEEKRRADEAARLAEEKRKADEAARLAEEKRRADEAARLAEEKRKADEAAGLAEEKRKADEAAGLAEEKRKADEAAGLAEEKRRADEAARLAEVKRRADEAARLAEEKRKADEAAGLAEEKRKADEAAVTRAATRPWEKQGRAEVERQVEEEVPQVEPGLVEEEVNAALRAEERRQGLLWSMIAVVVLLLAAGGYALYTTQQREAQQQEAQQQEAQQREAQQREAQQREAQQREAQQREAQQREAQQREAQQREAQQREAQQREAQQQEAARQTQWNEAVRQAPNLFSDYMIKQKEEDWRGSRLIGLGEPSYTPTHDFMINICPDCNSVLIISCVGVPIKSIGDLAGREMIDHVTGQAMRPGLKPFPDLIWNKLKVRPLPPQELQIGQCQADLARKACGALCVSSCLYSGLDPLENRCFR